jgi:hypothetical protein
LHWRKYGSLEKVQAICVLKQQRVTANFTRNAKPELPAKFLGKTVTYLKIAF